jgi:hypothetical protein
MTNRCYDFFEKKSNVLYFVLSNIYKLIKLFTNDNMT